MPEDVKSEPQGSHTEDAPRFEDALEELQQIVGELEDGSLGLEESMQRFERGLKLLGSCYRYLEEAEKKIEMLTGFDAEGNPQTEPFDDQATFAQGGPANRATGRQSRAKKGGESNSGGEAAGDGAAAEDEGETLF